MPHNAHSPAIAPFADVPIAYRRFGAPGRTPVLIVHGLSYFSYDWIDVAGALAGDRETVAMDMRGFGDSGRSSDYSIAANAADFIRLIDHLGWQSAVLVGHSMGGRHCMYCAARNPERVRALVAAEFAPTVDPAGGARVARSVGTQPDAFASLDDCIAWCTGKRAQDVDERTRARFEQYTVTAPGGGVTIKRDLAFRDQFKRILETGQRPPAPVDLWQVLADLRSPALFIRGKRSDMFSAETAQRVLATNARAELVELDTGHDLGGEDPQGLVRVTREFLARHAL